MRIASQLLRLSATDLSNHLACHHLSVLDLSVARGAREAPDWKSPDLAIIRQLGNEHEQAYLGYLANIGLGVHDLRQVTDEAQAVAQTIALMKQGVDVIAQGPLAKRRWFARPDVLRKPPQQTTLGDCS